MVTRISAWSAGISYPPDTMARAPSASSVVAPTRIRPSLMLNGICADATDNAPADNAGSTIRRNMTSFVPCPLSLARIAAPNPPGSSPAPRADSPASAPLPATRPGTAGQADTRPGGGGGARKGGRQREHRAAAFARHGPWLVKGQRQTPAQSRTRHRGVDVVQDQPAARQRNVRGKADVLRQRVGGFEIEQRSEIDAANFQTDAGLGLLRPWFGDTLRFGIEASSRDLHVQQQRRVPDAGRRPLKFHRPFAHGDGPIEPQPDK